MHQAVAPHQRPRGVTATDSVSERVRGTKNPDLASIVVLRPDVVPANQEENRRNRRGASPGGRVPVWVTVIRTLDEAMASLRRMFRTALGWPEPSWLARAGQAWREPAGGPRSAW